MLDLDFWEWLLHLRKEETLDVFLDLHTRRELRVGAGENTPKPEILGNNVLDGIELCIYNVITMKTTIISIGNSKGVRIPKPLLEISGLGNEIELKVKGGEIRIIAVEPTDSSLDTALASEKALGKDWSRPEEDVAWASLR